MKIRVLEVQTALESGEEGLPAGGFEKIQRKEQQPKERPGHNKTPRRQEEHLPVVSAANPPEEQKGVVEMNNNGNGNTQPQAPFVPRFEICPVCGFFNKVADKTTKEGEPVHYLVCKGCDGEYRSYVSGCDEKYRTYADQVAEEIAAGKNPVILLKVVPSKFEWVLTQLNIESIEKKLEDARLMMGVHNTRYSRLSERVMERIGAYANSKTLPQEVFISLKKRYEKDLTQEDASTASKDIDLVRRLNVWLIATKKLKLELEKALAEKAANDAAGKIVTCNPDPDPAPITPVPELTS